MEADFAQEPSKVHWARADARIAKTLSRAGHADHGDEKKDHDDSKKQVDVTSMSVDYTVGDDTFEGFVAYPTSAKGPLPGLLISHAWYGLGEGEMMRAEEAAAKGYAAFALDMYGKGKRATSVPEAMALRGELGSLGAEVQQERALAGLDQFRDGGVVAELGVDVDTDQLYASGYSAKIPRRGTRTATPPKTARGCPSGRRAARSRARTSPSRWSTAPVRARHPRLSHTVRPLPPARIRRGRRIPPPERSLPRPR